MMEKTLILKHISRMLCLLISYSKFTRTRKLFFLAFPTFISYNYFKTDMCTDLTGKGREFYGKYEKYAEKKRR